MRVFIAVQVPSEVQAALAGLQREIRDRLRPQAAAALRFMPAANMHLTLLFLGETGAETVAGVTAKLAEVCAGFAPFQLEATGTGCFPHCRRPRVLWAGLGGEVASLMALQEALAGAVLPLCANADGKAFRPHLTLARLDARAGAAPKVNADLSRIRGLPFAGPGWRVDSVLLMQSVQHGPGVRYKTLSEHALGRTV